MKCILIGLLALVEAASGGLRTSPPQNQRNHPLILWIDGGLEGDLPGVERERERVRAELQESFPESEFKLIHVRDPLDMNQKLNRLEVVGEISHLFVDAHGNENVIFLGPPRGAHQSLRLASDFNPPQPHPEALFAFNGVLRRFQNDSRIVFRSCRILQGSPDEANQRMQALGRLFGLQAGMIYANSLDGVIPPESTLQRTAISLLTTYFKGSVRLAVGESWEVLRKAIGSVLFAYQLKSLYKTRVPNLSTFYALIWLPIEGLTTIQDARSGAPQLFRLAARSSAELAYLAHQRLNEQPIGKTGTWALWSLASSTLTFLAWTVSQSEQNFALWLENIPENNLGYLARFADGQIQSFEESTYEAAERQFVAPR